MNTEERTMGKKSLGRNKENLYAWSKKWREKNKESIAKYRKEYLEKNRDRINKKDRERWARRSNNVCAKIKLDRAANPEKYKDRDLRKSYGLDLMEYNKFLEIQNGVCAICKKKETHVIRGRVVNLSVDHNHNNGKIRGLLCCSCNVCIGHLRESPEIAERMMSYIIKYNKI